MEVEEWRRGRSKRRKPVGSIPKSFPSITDADADADAALRGIPAAPYLDGYGSVRNGFTMGIVIPISQYPWRV